MAETVYVICAAASGLCAVLLLRAHLRAPSRLLFWSTVCFTLLTLNNVLVVVDLAITGDGPDLSELRSGAGLAGMLALLYGLITDATEPRA